MNKEILINAFQSFIFVKIYTFQDKKDNWVSLNIKVHYSV